MTSVSLCVSGSVGYCRSPIMKRNSAQVGRDSLMMKPTSTYHSYILDPSRGRLWYCTVCRGSNNRNIYSLLVRVSFKRLLPTVKRVAADLTIPQPLKSDPRQPAAIIFFSPSRACGTLTKKCAKKAGLNLYILISDC